MSSKRATLAAAKSLKSISKVCSLDPIKCLSPLRNLSTAAERLDSPSANGYCNDDLPANIQNPDGVCSDYQNSPGDFQQSVSTRSGFGRHPDGQNGNFSGYTSSGSGDNSIGGYRESYGGGDYQNRRAGDNAKFWDQFSSNLQQSSSAVRGQTSMGLEQKPRGFQQNQSRASAGSFENGSPPSAVNVNGYANGYQSGVSTGGFNNGTQPSTVNLSGYADSYQNQNVGHLRHYNDVAKSSNFQSTGQVPSIGHGQSMYSPGNSHGQGFSDASPKPNSFYPQGLPSTLQERVGNHPHNLARPQENIGQNIWNSGNVQDNHNMSQQSPYHGQCQMNPNYTQSGSISPQAVNGSQSKEESSGPESTGYVGSIEEFDVLCREGKVKEVVEVLTLLESNHILLDLPRYVQLMQLCGDNEAIKEAKAVNEHIMRCISPVSVYMYNRILVMYLKCGSIEEAFAVFDKMGERNLTTWDTMIAGLAKNGLGEEAIDIFTKFKEAGFKPDGQMFISVFFACGVVGDAHEGMLHFESLAKDYGIIPSMEHYASVVDMLGRIGHLDEALEFIERMPFQPSIEVWETLLNLCRIHGERELGDRCAEIIGELDPLRLNEQSRSGLVPVNKLEMAKEEEKKKAAKKDILAARSMIHEYRAGDTSHPMTDQLYAQLRRLRVHMKEAGYVPETKCVLHDVDQESKEDALLAHSERLAFSRGLLDTPARSMIRIIKNLRVCPDCHNALKFMSKLVGRKIVMRDAKRFHHFEDGDCSCKDYW
ncbi:hypothetical protein CDL15_Pgr023749 [Punica granatum]|uniref:DYW domain-containing protein n=1 Tax=Punica granatum TaxID=22663 RepID=A0A218WRY0_PUNGR|nr:hypothetical protein CDL15_Pgr023749 [Punica granatum]